MDALGELGKEKQIAVGPSPDVKSTAVDGAVSVASQDLLARESVEKCLDGVILRVVSSFLAKEEAMETLGVVLVGRIHGANGGGQAASSFLSDDNGPHVGDKPPRVCADLTEPGGDAVPCCTSDSFGSNGFETTEAKLSLQTPGVVDEVQVSRHEDVSAHSPNQCAPRHGPYMESAEVKEASPRADHVGVEGGEDVASDKAACCSVEGQVGIAEVHLRALSLASSDPDAGFPRASSGGGDRGSGEKEHDVSRNSPGLDAPMPTLIEDLGNGELKSTLGATGVDGEHSKARSKDASEHGSGSSCTSFEQSLENGLRENKENGRELDDEGDHGLARGENNEALPTGESSCAVPESPFSNLVEPPSRVVNSDGLGDPAAIDLYACMDHFFAEEELVAAEGNGYDCEKCRLALTKSRTAGTEGKKEVGIDEEKRKQDGCVYDGVDCGERSMGSTKRDARKRLLMLGEPPGVLVCHLKRLQAQKKILTRVEFPEELDMGPYFWRDPEV